LILAKIKDLRPIKLCSTASITRKTP